MIKESIHCYREMLGIYARVRDAVASGAPAERLGAMIMEVQELDERARAADARVRDRMEETWLSEEELSLYEEWKELLGRVREENRLLGDYLRSAMTVLREDIRRLRQGKQAASGYRSRQDVTGRRIDISSA